jgi:uridine monophosphate synthetase
MGFITQQRVTDQPGFLHFTPGVKLASGEQKDSLGQRYTTPEVAIGEHGADVIIVGRGIYQADEPLVAAKAYRQAGWAAYGDRVQSNLI